MAPRRALGDPGEHSLEQAFETWIDGGHHELRKGGIWRATDGELTKLVDPRDLAAIARMPLETPAAPTEQQKSSDWWLSKPASTTRTPVRVHADVD